MVMRALSQSLSQLGDRRIIGIFAKSMLITFILFVLLFGTVVTSAQLMAERFGLLSGDDSWIGEDVWIDNLATFTIGANCCISQGAGSAMP